MRRHLVLAFALLACAACSREEPLPMAPGPSGTRKVDIETPRIQPHVYDHFTRADLVSAANSRYGQVDVNLTSKIEVAEQAAQDAETYLGFAAKQAESNGATVEAEYEREAAAELKQAVQLQKSGDAVKARETLLSARRHLDMAIEQTNVDLTK